MQFTVATTNPAATAQTRSGVRRFFSSRATRLWTVQALLAALFLFAGAAKLAVSAENLTANTWLPAEFLRFIGACEVLGAVGIVLPGTVRIRRELVAIAAGCLAVIMVGATVLTVAAGDFGPAVFPFVVGLLTVYVASGRRGAVVTR